MMKEPEDTSKSTDAVDGSSSASISSGSSKVMVKRQVKIQSNSKSLVKLKRRRLLSKSRTSLSSQRTGSDEILKQPAYYVKTDNCVKVVKSVSKAKVKVKVKKKRLSLAKSAKGPTSVDIFDVEVIDDAASSSSTGSFSSFSSGPLNEPFDIEVIECDAHKEKSQPQQQAEELDADKVSSPKKKPPMNMNMAKFVQVDGNKGTLSSELVAAGQPVEPTSLYAAFYLVMFIIAMLVALVAGLIAYYWQLH